MESTNKISTKVNVLDSIHYVSTAWDEIKLDVIINCFRKAAFGVLNNSEQADSLPLEEEGFQLLQNFVDYATVDDELKTSSTRTLDEIIADMNLLENEKECDDEEERYRQSNIYFYNYCWFATSIRNSNSIILYRTF